MAKISNEYLEIHPYKIIEKGFHKDRALVSESLFSLGNEYSGVRGFFDEDYSDKKLIGTYYNGIYEYSLTDTPSAYKSIVKRTHFTINSLNWLAVQIKVGDEVLDLNKSKFADFYRELDLTNGVYLRSFVWNTKNANITITFERILSFVTSRGFSQRTFTLCFATIWAQSRCIPLGVKIQQTSISSFSSIVSISVYHFESPFSSAAFFAFSSTTSQTATSSA